MAVYRLLKVLSSWNLKDIAAHTCPIIRTAGRSDNRAKSVIRYGFIVILQLAEARMRLPRLWP
jgi:hypothetical protein